MPEAGQLKVPPLNIKAKLTEKTDRSKSDNKPSSNREILESNRDVALNILLKNSSKKVQIEVIPKMNKYAYVKKKRYIDELEKKTRHD